MFGWSFRTSLHTLMFALAILTLYRVRKSVNTKVRDEVDEILMQMKESKKFTNQARFQEDAYLPESKMDLIISRKTSRATGGSGDFVTFSVGSGNFGGYQRFLDLLDAKNSSLVQPAKSKSRFSGCHLVLGDTTNLKNKKYWKMKNVVWLTINAEDPANELIWKGRKKTQNPRKKSMQARVTTSKNHRQLILGNFWKKGVKDYVKLSLGVISFWVPFLSMNFSERHEHTPLDLNSPGTIFRRKQRYLAYMNSVCVKFREKLWDDVNEILGKSGVDFRADALGKCHGSIPRNGSEQLRQGHYSYDGHVKVYKKYDFITCAEHNLNHIGYVTEKIGNVILAGRVPIYGGFSQISSIINPKRFIAHNKLEELNDLLLNDTKYYEMINEPAITREAMIEYFSWHPAVISKYSENKQRRKIFDALSQLCKDIKSHDVS